MPSTGAQDFKLERMMVLDSLLSLVCNEDTKSEALATVVSGLESGQSDNAIEKILGTYQAQEIMEGKTAAQKHALTALLRAVESGQMDAYIEEVMEMRKATQTKQRQQNHANEIIDGKATAQARALNALLAAAESGQLETSIQEVTKTRQQQASLNLRNKAVDSLLNSLESGQLDSIIKTVMAQPNAGQVQEPNTLKDIKERAVSHLVDNLESGKLDVTI